MPYNYIDDKYENEGVCNSLLEYIKSVEEEYDKEDAKRKDELNTYNINQKIKSLHKQIDEYQAHNISDSVNPYRAQNNQFIYHNSILERNFKIERMKREVARLEEQKQYHKKYTKKWLYTEQNRFYYRGHYDSQYNLVPSIMRGNRLEKENYYYHQIKVQCPDKFSKMSHLEQLVLMQHYDCPTRLLDITSSPLVALYFACKNFGCGHCESSENGTVYVFKVPENQILYYDSDRALMLSCLAKFNMKEKEDIYEECINKMKGGKSFDNTRFSDEMEKLYHEICSENPSFEKRINPSDLLSSFFVQPLKSNNRILKQDGAFIISGLSLNEEEAEYKLNKLVCKKIKIENQVKILKELDRMGINEATLFPEVDKVADYLKSTI